MDRNSIRRNLGDRIAELGAARDKPGATPAEKAAAQAAIKELQDARDELNMAANEEFASQVNTLVAKLEAVRTSRNLDAASALGVAIKKVKALTDKPQATA